MQKRAFIVHGWEGSPEEGWFPWLQSELEEKGYEVKVPAMPNSAEPKIDVWPPFLAKQVETPDENTYLVGHSMGCQTILRYLEPLPENTKIGGVVLVAGFVNLVNLSTPEEKRIAKPWLTIPIEWNKVKMHTKNFVAIFSDNDPWVPLSDSDIFKEKLGAKVIVESNKGHFSGADGAKELPVVFEELQKM